MVENLLKNSSNQIRFTAVHEKNTELITNPNFNSLDFLKIYVKILDTYRHIDSDMLSPDSSKVLEKSGQDLDETMKIKTNFNKEKKDKKNRKTGVDAKKEIISNLAKPKRDSSAKVISKKTQK